jgi:hypothetical protein
MRAAQAPALGCAAAASSALLLGAGPAAAAAPSAAPAAAADQLSAGAHLSAVASKFSTSSGTSSAYGRVSSVTRYYLHVVLWIHALRCIWMMLGLTQLMQHSRKRNMPMQHMPSDVRVCCKACSAMITLQGGRQAHRHPRPPGCRPGRCGPPRHRSAAGTRVQKCRVFGSREQDGHVQMRGQHLFYPGGISRALLTAAFLLSSWMPSGPSCGRIPGSISSTAARRQHHAVFSTAAMSDRAGHVVTQHTRSRCSAENQSERNAAEGQLQMA